MRSPRAWLGAGVGLGLGLGLGLASGLGLGLGSGSGLGLGLGLGSGLGVAQRVVGTRLPGALGHDEGVRDVGRVVDDQPDGDHEVDDGDGVDGEAA